MHVRQVQWPEPPRRPNIIVRACSRIWDVAGNAILTLVGCFAFFQWCAYEPAVETAKAEPLASSEPLPPPPPMDPAPPPPARLRHALRLPKAARERLIETALSAPSAPPEPEIEYTPPPEPVRKHEKPAIVAVSWKPPPEPPRPEPVKPPPPPAPAPEPVKQAAKPQPPPPPPAPVEPAPPPPPPPPAPPPVIAKVAPPPPPPPPPDPPPVVAVAPAPKAEPPPKPAESAPEPPPVVNNPVTAAIAKIERDKPQRVKPKVRPKRPTPMTPEEAAYCLAMAWERISGEKATPEVVSVLWAQWALETGRGHWMMDYNYAGLKGNAPDGGLSHWWTWEETDQGARRVRSRFRSYETAEQGANDYVEMLVRRYPRAAASAQRGDAISFVLELDQGGFFTERPKHYVRSVASLALEFRRKRREGKL